MEIMERTRKDLKKFKTKAEVRNEIQTNNDFDQFLHALILGKNRIVFTM